MIIPVAGNLPYQGGLPAVYYDARDICNFNCKGQEVPTKAAMIKETVIEEGNNSYCICKLSVDKT